VKLSRRTFLVSCAAIALNVGVPLPALPATHGLLARYYGNPNVTATAGYGTGVGTLTVASPGTPVPPTITISAIVLAPTVVPGYGTYTIQNLTVSSTVGLANYGSLNIAGTNTNCDGTQQKFYILNSTTIVPIYLNTLTGTYSGAGTVGQNKVYTGVALTGGSGTGATADISVDAYGGVVAAIVANGGKNYAVNDTLAIPSASIGGCTGASLTVATLGIAFSRYGDTMQTPAFVHVCANGFSFDGTNPPFSAIRYHDIEYTWNFGDPTGTEVFANPYSGAQDNMNSAQVGPQATYCYRGPATGSTNYTITCTARWWNGTSYQTTVQTLVITVAAFNASGGTYYFDPQAPSSGANGTMANPYNSLQTGGSSIQSLSATSNRQFLIKRGGVWTDANAMILGGGSNIRIGAYGTGANPKILHTSASNGSQSMIYVTYSPKDVVISDIDSEVSGPNIAGKSLINIFAFGSTAYQKNIYIDNCNMFYDSSVTSSDPLSFGSTAGNTNDPNLGLTCSGFWGCNVWCATSGSNGPAVGNGSGIGSGLYGFVCGMTMNGNGGNGTQSHYFYSLIQNYALFSYINLPDSTTEAVYDCFKISSNEVWSDHTVVAPRRHVNVRDTYLSGVPFGTEITYSLNPITTPYANFNNIVFERLRYTGLTGNFTSINNPQSANDATYRDCLVWNNASAWFLTANTYAPNGIQISAYRNNIYVTGTAAFAIIWTVSTATPALQQITDNNIWDVRTTAAIWSTVLSQYTASLIDRNNYKFTSTTPFNNNGSAIGFTDWQTAGNAGAGWTYPLDANSSYNGSPNAFPAWINPALGNFNVP
jgi:hypothetical protein